jgi:hypothetical protein
MDDVDKETIEKSLLARFFELAQKENELGKNKKGDAKLTAEIDRIQSALRKIKGAPQS